MRTALLLVDVQYDFLPPSGSLAVPSGESILPGLQRLLREHSDSFDLVIASQDFHPPGHVSFASSHPGAAPFSRKAIDTKKAGGDETVTLWPDHCVQRTKGCEIESSLLGTLIGLPQFVLVRKGDDLDREEYSAFGGRSALHRAGTGMGLASVLRDARVERLVVGGLATDYCVRASVSDAVALGDQLKEVVVLEDAVRGIEEEACRRFLDQECKEQGVRVMTSADLIDELTSQRPS